MLWYHSVCVYTRMSTNNSVCGCSVLHATFAMMLLDIASLTFSINNATSYRCMTSLNFNPKFKKFNLSTPLRGN